MKKTIDNDVRKSLFNHSKEYFMPNKSNPDGLSNFEVDLAMMEPAERVGAEIRILDYHTSKLKSMDVDITVAERTEKIDERLSRLALENEGGDE